LHGCSSVSYTHRCAFDGGLEVEAFKEKRMVKIRNQNDFQVLYLAKEKTGAVKAKKHQ